jgi:hypothetical protein
MRGKGKAKITGFAVFLLENPERWCRTGWFEKFTQAL